MVGQPKGVAFDIVAGLTISIVCGGALAGALYVIGRFLESSV